MTRRHRRRGGADHGGHDGGDERWLLTYADMLTLLFALFMVLFAMSSVNISKAKALQQSLRTAFSGKVLPGGQALMQTGGDQVTKLQLPDMNPRVSTNQAKALKQRSQMEEKSFEQLKREIDAQVRAQGLARNVTTQITRRGLDIRIVTDHLLFESGQATIMSAGASLIDRLAPLLRAETGHQLIVEGFTDNQPIQSGQFPSNWELSTARSSAVVRRLLGRGIAEPRLSASGRADLDPLASNATAAGRARNRRVEIVLPRSDSVTEITSP
jgi:chemotaxis protein MotB